MYNYVYIYMYIVSTIIYGFFWVCGAWWVYVYIAIDICMRTYTHNDLYNQTHIYIYVYIIYMPRRYDMEDEGEN